MPYRRYTYDYYTVSVPGDLEATIKGLGRWAIRDAEERASIWAVPCEWTAEPVSGKVGDYEVKFRVRRKRFKRWHVPRLPRRTRGSLVDDQARGSKHGGRRHHIRSRRDVL